jgi:hypothetical protein
MEPSRFAIPHPLPTMCGNVRNLGAQALLFPDSVIPRSDMQKLLFLVEKIKKLFGRLAADVKDRPAPREDDEGDDF